MEELELDKLKGDRKIPVRTLVKRILKIVKPALPRMMLAVLFLLLHVGLTVFLPWLEAKEIGILTEVPIALKVVIALAVGFFLISVVNNVFLYLESMILQKSGQGIIYQLRLDVFRHIENMSQNQFNEMPVGSLVTRVASYTQSMSDLFTDVLVNMMKNALTVLGVFGVMVFVSPTLSLFLLIPFSIVFVSSLVFSTRIRQLLRTERRYVSDMNTYLNENLTGMKITQIFNQEKRKLKEFNEKNEALRKIRYKGVLAFGIYRPFITFLYIASVGITFYFGLKLNMQETEIIAFYLYLSMFFNPIQQLADQVNKLQKAFTASERLFNLMDVQPEVRDRADAVEIQNFRGKIEFDHVWFSYKPDHWILKDVSFVIQPGETVAFVGATGAGKTTILSLIVRNYEIQKGTIRIDDRDIRQIKIASLRRGIGQMLQDVSLFSGTIKNNITLHDEQYTDEEVWEACRYVQADRFIQKLPSGLEEELSERGENLSQGQRQLISFARTFLYHPQILILDEATASIDTETEALIQSSLEKMKNIGTMLVVAHRLSTIQHADRIIVLHHGAVVESGNHQELLQKRGRYYKLYQLQFDGSNN